ncbi:MAG: AraC family transcriptional regulator [Firmicutes bacterium]|nr:AraC family transcriptional regulator [Bacillota bacterium]
MKNILEFHYHQRGYDRLNNIGHFHDDSYEILHIISGDGSIIINNKLYSLNQNDIYLINGSCTHCTIPNNTDKYIRNKLVVNKTFMNSLLKIAADENIIGALFLKNGGAYVKLNQIKSANVNDIFLGISNMLDKRNYNAELYITSQLLYLIYLCSENITDNIVDKDGIIEQIFVYIDKNLSSPLSIDTISKAIHINKYYLCHKFKKDTNMTINQYIVNARISMAKQLLAETEKSISDIAIDVGFVNFSHFSTTFLKIVGLSPHSFRKQIK